jgi:hypothetical protein
MISDRPKEEGFDREETRTDPGGIIDCPFGEN